MAGHGSPAPDDKAPHPGRQVGRRQGVSRLTEAMAWQGILSSGEAQGAMRELRGEGYGGEAVEHYGGAQRLAADAFRNRNRMLPVWRENPLRGEGHTPEPVQSERWDNAGHSGRQVHQDRPSYTMARTTGIRGGSSEGDWSAEEGPPYHGPERGDPTQGHTWKPSPEKFE